jgi:hypothetical protein
VRHNTTWDDPRQDLEPFKPLPTTFEHSTNDENLGKYPHRFMKRPSGPNYSNNYEVINFILPKKEADKNQSSLDFLWGNREPVSASEVTKRVLDLLPPDKKQSILDVGNGTEQSFRLMYDSRSKTWVSYMNTTPLPIHLNQYIIKILKDHKVIPIQLTPRLHDAATNKEKVAEAAGRFVSSAKLILNPKGAHKPGTKWGLSWSVYVTDDMKPFLKLLGFNITSKGLTDDDDIKKLEELGFVTPSPEFIESVRRGTVIRQVVIVREPEVIKNNILKALSSSQEEYEYLGEWFDQGYVYEHRKKELVTSKQAEVYTDKAMEDIYVKQHEYNDNPGGGNVYHDFNNSSTDYPKSPSKPKVQLDRLTTPPNNVLPSYEVTWFNSLPRTDDI